MNDEALAIFVGLALPKRSQVAIENFAGDPLVEEFVALLQKTTGMDINTFISWACPASVMVVRSPVGNAVIRSERLDTLFVEYTHLAEVRRHVLAPEDLEEAVSTTILRWIAEFMIGYRQPSVALAALEKRPARLLQVPVQPFRDESLASIPPIRRAAVQCYSLAHEMGHLQSPERRSVTLDNEFDGIPIMRHLERDISLPGITDEVKSRLRDTLRSQIEAAALFGELDADVFALEAVTRYLLRVFSCDVGEAIEATLSACEAQNFICSCMQSCKYLQDGIPGPLDTFNFTSKDFVAGSQASVRARVGMRRAGILWAILENPGKSLKAADINSYVPKVDALFVAHQDFLSLTTQKVCDHTAALGSEYAGLAPVEIDAKLRVQIDALKENTELGLELFHILLAFGHPGGTDVVHFLESLAE